MIFEKIRERLKLATRDFLDGAGSITFETSAIPTNRAIDIINQVEAEYTDVLSNMYYHSGFERRINEVIPMLKTLHLLGTISLINDLKAENDILRSYLPQPPKGE